jgi:hypothetical protein
VPAVVQPGRQLVGQVTGLVNCRWSDSHTAAAYLGRRVAAGDEFVLASGLAEITYDTGAKVLLQGPVTYQVDSPRGGFLSVGKLTACVEKKVASGQKSNPKSLILNAALFAVRTPTAVIIDLGTEFGVEVSNEGCTSSHVYRGAVRFEVTSGNGTSKPAKVLHANESAQTERAGNSDGEYHIVVLESSSSGTAFVRELPKCVVKTFDLVDVVAGGNGFSGCRSNRGIHPVTGQIVPNSAEYATLMGDGKYHRVPSSPFVDGVFTPNASHGPVQIDSAGHVFEDFECTSNFAGALVLAGGKLPFLPKNPSRAFISGVLDGVDYSSTGHGLIFMHPDKGVTFDLDAVRRANPGFRIARFLTVVGNTSPEGNSLGDIRVFVDGQKRFQRRDINSYGGAQPIDVTIDDNNRFLTFAVTAPQGFSSVWIVFGDPRLELVSINPVASQPVATQANMQSPQPSVSVQSSQTEENAN